eukprot:TRINITY_DN5593_c0_g1_i3.p1 TRINITY_DN5593_c0_g1~~TRINITY_DN5593_c0_g1_i3.p1  ORF type:complete len:404 (+),score=136.19 TRINITY_DN5593_c0_g1_i3:52-1263(+)
MSRLSEGMKSEVETQSSLNSEGKPSNRHFINSFMLSFGFFLMFSAFNGTSNLLTSGKDAHIGYVASAIIYAFFAFGSLFVSTGVLSQIGPKWSIPIGALTYTIFQATNLKGQEWWQFLWISAGLLGVGASILWSAQGSYLTIAAKNHAFSRGLPADASQGMFQGLFFGILQLNQVVGNLCSGFIFLYATSGAEVLMRVYMGLSIVGLIVLSLLPNEKEQNITEDKGQIPLTERISAVARLHFDKKLLLMVPVLFYSGMEQGFLVGDLTKAIGHGIGGDNNPSYGKAYIGFSMVVFGVIDATCSFVFGKFVIKSHKRIVLLIGTIGHGALYAFIIYANGFSEGGMEKIFSNHVWSIFLCTACAGIADSVWNVAPATLVTHNSSLFLSIQILMLFNFAAWNDVSG